MGSKPTPLERLHAWLIVKFGDRYGTAIDTIDRAVTVFIAAVTAKAVGSGLNIAHVTSMSYWQTLAGAGIAAVLTLAQSTLSSMITGTAALSAPISRTLRARRAVGYFPLHDVPIRRKASVRP